MPNTGPSAGSRRQITAFLPMRLSASPRPTVVVVLPSPAGVGLIAVTRISLRFRRCAQALEIVQRDLRLVMAVRLQMLLIDAQALARQRGDSCELRLLRNLDIACHSRPKKKRQRCSLPLDYFLRVIACATSPYGRLRDAAA